MGFGSTVHNRSEIDRISSERESFFPSKHQRVSDRVFFFVIQWTNITHLGTSETVAPVLRRCHYYS
jgi:hypothetical protein